MGKLHALRLSDIRNVFRLLNEIRELRAKPVEAKCVMINGLCRLVGARQGTAMSWSGFAPGGRLRLLDFVPGGWASDEAAAIWQQLMKMDDWRGDPILNRAVQIPGRVLAFLQDELVPRSQWERSTVRYEVARRAGVDENIVAWYRRDRSDAVEGIALHRAWSDRPFGERQRNILHLFNLELYRLFREGKLDLGRKPLPRLSPRRQEVLDRLLAGDSEKQVARFLGISPFTVNDHVKAIYRQAGVNSRGELMARFIEAK